MAENKNMKDKLKLTFRALKHKNFRYFWTGQCISLIGTWMQNIGQAWLVYSLTQSAFLLGLLSTLQFLPMLLFSLFAGVIVDKFPKKKILLCTQTTLMVLAFVLSVLVWTGIAQYWHILVLALLLGCVNTIDMPTRQAFMIELVGREDLMNAIALNSSIFNIARIIGPAVAGIMMGLLGAAFCFLLNGLSFIAVIIGLILIKTEPFVRKVDGKKKVFKDIKEGLIYTKQNPGLLFILITLMIINVFIMNYNVTVPVFVKNILHQEETVYGMLMSAMGVGSFIGAISVASKSKGAPNRRKIYASSLVTAFMLIPLGLSSNFYLAMAILAVTGYFTISFSAMANSTVQLSTADEYRGRVMSLYTMVFAGTTPFGSLIAGSVMDWAGPSIGFILSGGVAVILVVIVLFIKNNRDRKYDMTGTLQG